MSSPRDVLRRQRRRELDARRSKSRVRLGGCLQSWGQLKESLGFTLHSELAQFLLERHVPPPETRLILTVIEGEKERVVTTSVESLQCLVLQVHCHAQRCPCPPTLRPLPRAEDDAVCGGQPAGEGEGRSGGRRRGLRNSGKQRRIEVAESSQEEAATQPSKGSRWNLELRCSCREGHGFSWCAFRDEGAGDGQQEPQPNGAASAAPGTRVVKETKTELDTEDASPAEDTGSRRHCVEGLTMTTGGGRQLEEERTEIEDEPSGERCAQQAESDAGSDVLLAEPTRPQELGQPSDSEDLDKVEDRSAYCFCLNPREPVVVPQRTTRGRQRKASETPSVNSRAVMGDIRRGKRTGDDDAAQISGKRKRKATPRDILPCEFDGCGKIFSTRQYLNHHMKYQHFQQKTFCCSHPACGKSFNFKKHLKEHEKLHSNQRDYICEFCARAFRTSSNLIIHRRIHTGEKPLQCEVCGFTCRQKASLNWHMRKHDAESFYQFPCEICGRRFEKRDNVTAHRSKSHPDQTPGPPPAPTAGSSSPALGSVDSRGYALR
ncbi:zinc finger protein 692-like [Arapaima gigas]